jgi:aminoglycoside phosphotransferase (APT) family kinase protein
MKPLLRSCALLYRSSAMSVQTREQLRSWILTRKQASEAEVSPIESPANTGYSHQTMLLDASWTAEGRRHAERFVAKLLRPGHDVFLEPDFAAEYRVMKALQGSGVPLAPTLGYEEDPSWLGAPFYVIGRVDGVIPPDNPPYTFGGWLLEASPAEQEQIWWSGLEAMTRVHALDPDALGLGFLDRPEWGATGLEQRLNYYEHYLHWAYDGPQETALKALEWLRAHRPEEPRPPVLLWGDARIGNVIYDKGRPQAVLDWETATLGAPEEDLAWFMFLDRHHSEGIGAPRLDGFPSYEETVARYEEMLGRPVRHMDYYEVLSGFKFSVIMARIGQAMIDFGWIEPDNDFPYNNNCTRLLAQILGLPAPGSEASNTPDVLGGTS